MSLYLPLDALAAAIEDGARLAIPREVCGVSMAATAALVRRRARGLRLVCIPTGGIQVDILIGAGCVDTIETAAVSLGELGPAPRFLAALGDRALGVIDSTCPALHAALQAGEKGLPFMPLRGLLGTDLLQHRADWRVIDNPFAAGDRIVALPAIVPDAALFHAPLADREGNVYVGRQRELVTLGHAARRTFVTVEAVSPTSLLEDPLRASGVLPAIYVEGISVAPHGAVPVGLPGAYAADDAALGRYATLARTDAGFAEWLDAWLQAAAA